MLVDVGSDIFAGYYPYEHLDCHCGYFCANMGEMVVVLFAAVFTVASGWNSTSPVLRQKQKMSWLSDCQSCHCIGNKLHQRVDLEVKTSHEACLIWGQSSCKEMRRPSQSPRNLPTRQRTWSKQHKCYYLHALIQLISHLLDINWLYSNFTWIYQCNNNNKQTSPSSSCHESIALSSVSSPYLAMHSLLHHPLELVLLALIERKFKKVSHHRHHHHCWPRWTLSHMHKSHGISPLFYQLQLLYSHLSVLDSAQYRNLQHPQTYPLQHHCHRPALSWKMLPWAKPSEMGGPAVEGGDGTQLVDGCVYYYSNSNYTAQPA